MSHLLPSRKEKGAARMAPDDPKHETYDTIASAVNEPGGPYFEGGRIVPIVDGIRDTAFDAEPPDVLSHLTPSERVSFELRIYAVRYVAGIEPRSFAEVAAELGVTRAA